MRRDDSSDGETLPRTGDTIREPQYATGAEPTEAHDPVEAPPSSPLPGYTIGRLIGSGGMGEVLVARDQRIGREVALKRLKGNAPSEEAVSRFMREARIQALLDHPAIVPVHELGHDPEGRPYFTMKQLTGVTLTQRLAERAPVQSLLRAFADVCHAVELAHSRGVIHRDLKPHNIMLGGFGEVYVLDWGLARTTTDPAPSKSGDSGSVTQLGELLGTPGYMAPEQVRADGVVEPSVDIYALGSILFEILAGEPLHPAGRAALATTLQGVNGAPSRRTPERNIAPELDTLCAAMLVYNPELRPTAHQVAIQIEAYLDGDRDIANRRALAAEDLARANLAYSGHQHAEAMRAAGRALALDPENRDAAALVSRLMLEPPHQPPRELLAEIARGEAESTRRHALSSLRAFVGVIVLSPLLIWNGVTSWTVLGAAIALAAVLAFAAFRLSRRETHTLRELWLYFLGAAAMLPLVSRMFGPFILAPAIAILMAMSALTYPLFARRYYLVLAPTLVAWLLPSVLEGAGLLEPTWAVGPGVVESTSGALAIGGTATVVAVFATTVCAIAIGTIHAATLSRMHLDAQRRLVGQAWHLQQLLPRHS